MSVQATTAVWNHSKARGADLIVMLAIADAANREGRNARPGMETLTKWTRKSERAVLYSIARLIKLGELQRMSSGVRGRVAVFTLFLPDLGERNGTLMNTQQGEENRRKGEEKWLQGEPGLHPFPIPSSHTSLQREVSEESSQTDPLVARMVSVCTGRNVEDEAEQVVSMLRQYVADHVIDEVIGWVGELDDPPRRPRYFLVAVRDYVARRGVNIPRLELAS